VKPVKISDIFSYLMNVLVITCLPEVQMNLFNGNVPFLCILCVLDTFRIFLRSTCLDYTQYSGDREVAIRTIKANQLVLFTAPIYALQQAWKANRVTAVSSQLQMKTIGIGPLLYLLQ
jgi:hypothetical protein